MTLSTELIERKWLIKKQHPKSQIYYLEIPNLTTPIKGASGAGLWMFKNDKIILQGMIVEQNKNKCVALDISYIQDNFIHKYKQFMSQKDN